MIYPRKKYMKKVIVLLQILFGSTPVYLSGRQQPFENQA